MPPARAKRSTTQSAEAVRWLSDDEQAAWRALNMLMFTLPWALECQLQRDAGLSFIEYHALARLSEGADHTLRMSELAVLTHASLSRLSHLVKRLESRGLVRREPDSTDGRYTNAILTKRGYAKLVEDAPAHVAAVRARVIDGFSGDELRQLKDFSERIVARVQQ
jgi:DNA-binding MarR family transcriptional regulator